MRRALLLAPLLPLAACYFPREPTPTPPPAPDQTALVSDVDSRIATLRAYPPRVHAEIKEMLLAGRGVDEDVALTMSIDRLVVGSLRRGE